MADPVTSSHPRHDRLLIASAVDRGPDVPPSLARALLATCLECARLYADLLALALALPSSSTPARPRDFTLSTTDAERLRPRGLRRWLGLIGTSRDTITRPLAIGFTTLGLAGLLVAMVPGAAADTDAPRREVQSAASSNGVAYQTFGPPDVPVDVAADPGVSPAYVAMSISFLLTGGALLVIRRARPRGHR